MFQGVMKRGERHDLSLAFRIPTIPARVVGLWRRSLVCSRNECSLAMNSGYP